MRTNMNHPTPFAQRGFSLIELMIALVLGLLVLLGLYVVFSSSTQNYREDSATAKLSEELRFGYGILTQDLEMTGFWSGTYDPIQITVQSGTNVADADECGPGVAGWSVDLTNPLAVANNIDTNVGDVFECLDLDDDDLVPGTDAIAIKRLIGVPIIPASGHAGSVAGDIYLRSNNTVGTLFTWVNSSSTPSSPAGTATSPIIDWLYSINIYYIRNYSVTAGDGIPSLCRKALGTSGGNPAYSPTECFASGIEDLQIEIGIDGNGDGLPDRFISAPTAVEAAGAVAVRVAVLARSEKAVSGYTNAKTYTLGDATHTPNDRFYRNLMISTVPLRNRAALNIINKQ